MRLEVAAAALREDETMSLALRRPHIHLDAHDPFWLWVAVIAAFLMVALWSTPLG